MGGTGGMISTLPDDLGDIPVIDEADVPCVTNTAATSTTVYAAGASPAAFDRLEQVGAAWLASGSVANGFALLSLDGSSASASLMTVATDANIAASTGLHVAAAGISAGTVQYQEYDDQGAPALIVGAIGTTDGDRVAVGGHAGEALVVWQDLGDVVGAGTDELGATSLPFTLGSGIVGTSLSAAIAPASSGFAVAWSHESAQYKATTRFAIATSKGLAVPAVEIAASTRTHRLVSMVRSSTGYALLFDGQDDTSGVYVLAIGSDGQKVGAAHRLLGAKHGRDLASLGDKLGVVVTLADDKLAFRALDPHGSVAGPWVCLGGSSADADHVAGVAPLGLGNGYAIIAHETDGAEQLISVDVLGTGAPQ
jgi:hypothetical protein